MSASAASVIEASVLVETVGSRVPAVVWAVAVGNLAIVMIYDLATLVTPAGAPGWIGAGVSLVVAALAGSLAGGLVVALRGGVIALVVLALLVIAEAALSAQGLSSVGRGYASWASETVPATAWEVRWAGLVSALFVGLVGRQRLHRVRGHGPTDGSAVPSGTAPG